MHPSEARARSCVIGTYLTRSGPEGSADRKPSALAALSTLSAPVNHLQLSCFTGRRSVLSQAAQDWRSLGRSSFSSISGRRRKVRAARLRGASVVGRGRPRADSGTRQSRNWGGRCRVFQQAEACESSRRGGVAQAPGSRRATRDDGQAGSSPPVSKVAGDIYGGQVLADALVKAFVTAAVRPRGCCDSSLSPPAKGRPCGLRMRASRPARPRRRHALPAGTRRASPMPPPAVGQASVTRAAFGLVRDCAPALQAGRRPCRA